MQLRFKTAAALALVLLSQACRQETKSPGDATTPLMEQFTGLTAPDTLYIAAQSEVGSTVETGGSVEQYPLSDSLLLSEVDTALLNKLLYAPADEETQFFARYRFPLDQRYEACLLEVHQFWFRFKGLLLFDRQSGRFTDVRPVAQFFGGDGGQVLEESWLFDWNKDGRRDLLIHHSEHYMDPEAADEEDMDRYVDSFQLFLWKGSGFELSADSLDQAQLIKEFPVEW